MQTRRIARALVIVLFAVAAGALMSACEPTATCTVNWTGKSSTDFANARNWDPWRIPGPSDHACSPEGSSIVIRTAVAPGSIEMSGRLTIRSTGSLTLNGASWSNVHDLVVSGGSLSGSSHLGLGKLTWSGGAMAGTGLVYLEEGAQSTLSGSLELRDTCSLFVRDGTIPLTNTTLSLCGDSQFVVVGSFAVGPNTTVGGQSCAQTGRGHLLNVGSLDVSANSVLGAVDNHGLLRVATGATLDAASFRQASAGAVTDLRPGAVVRVGGGAGTATFDDGTLTGSGVIDANVSGSPSITPGDSTVAGSTGEIAISGSLQTAADAELHIDVASTTPATGYDRVSVGGAAQVDGTKFFASLVGGAVVPVGSQLEPLVGASVTGTLTSAELPSGTNASWGVTTASSALRLRLSAASLTSPDGSIIDRPVELDAAVGYASTPPTGTVTFSDGGTPIGTATFDGTGHARLSTSTLSAGSHQLTASYPGDATHGASTVGPFGHEVFVPQNPMIAWDAPAAIGYSTPLGAPQLDATALGAGTFTYTPAAGTKLPVGTQTLTVDFTPSDPFAYTPASATTQIQVVAATTSVSLSGPASFVDPATSVPYTATVTAPSPATVTPTGDVQLKKGDTVLATATVDGAGKATLTGALPVGVSDVTATFLGGANFAPSTSNAVTTNVADHCLAPAAPGVNWSSCDLTDRNLDGINLAGANLAGANLTRTSFTGTTLTGVSSGGIAGAPASLPAGWSIRGGYLVGPGADLDGADLSFVNMNDANLDGASVVGASLKGVQYWRVSAVGTNFTGTNFLYADLRYSNFTGAIITNANVDQTYVLYNNLSNITSGGVTGQFSHFAMDDGSTWRIIGGWLIGPTTVISTLTFPTSLVGADFSGFNAANTNFSGKDLTNAAFAGSNITNANFTGATLTGVYSGGLVGTPVSLPAGWFLRAGYLVGPGANLTNANLAGANLAGINLTGANLTGANLTGANLSGTNLTGTALAGAISGGIVGVPSALPTGWTLTSGYFIGAGVNLTGAVLPGANLAGLDLANANFTNANLTNANLTGANLTNATLTGASISGANFSAATLTGVVTGGLVGVPAALPTGWQLTGGFLVGPGANLAGKDLSGLNLTGAHLAGANLTGANLTGANLSGADLTGANLTNADLSSTNLTGTVLTGINPAGLHSGGIVGTPAALPTGWTLVGGFLIGNGANLGGENLVGIDIAGLDLSGINLTGADLTGIDLHGRNLSNTVLTAAILVNANLDGADLSFRNLHNVNLQGASVVGANMRGVSFWYVNATGTDFTGTNLLYADMRYSAFTNAILTNANIDQTYVLYNTFDGLVTGGVTGSIGHFAVGDGASWRQVGGYFIGHGVNLTGATLSGLDLTGIDLRNVNLTNAVLNGTNLTNATMTNANITNANFTGATMTGVVSSGLVGTPAVLPPGYSLVGGAFVAN